MKWLLLFLLWPVAASAEDKLRVTILFGPGEVQTDYPLLGPDAVRFWQRWGQLPETASMVPLAASTGYRGLRVRDVTRDREVRLFAGVGAEGAVTRADGQRALERWVLTKAPQPLGPALVAKLDELVDVPGGPANVATGPEALAGALIGACRQRARHNDRLRARCLTEALLEHREGDQLVPVLEEALRKTEPPEALEKVLEGR